MPNEIRLTLLLEAVKNGMTAKLSKTETKDMSGVQMLSNIQTLSTSTEAIVLGDVAAPYRVAICNVDAAINVDISLDNANAQKVSTLNPGEYCLLNRPPAALYATGASGTPNIAVVAVEV